MGIVILTGVEGLISEAEAIPAFARRYQLSCTVCHVGIPKPNDFGKAFAANGYQLPDDDFSSLKMDVGDDKLLLMNDVPLAVRADSFFRTRTDTNTKNDLQAPFSIKLLSSAPLKKDISYYFYFFFNERGNVTGVEDAFIVFNNAYKGVDLDLRVGQFQVSDILFPREQRLTFQDFTYYTTTISDSGFRLTYDRIAELSYNFDVGDVGVGVWAAVANGNGIGVADSDRNFDSDNFKNFYGKVALEYGGQTVGFYGYSGKENNATGIRNEFFRIGPDFDFTLFDNFNVWGNFLYGKDTNPRFQVSPAADVDSWGYLTGITWPFMEDWIFSALYNGVRVQGRPDLNAETITGNVTYYIMRNLKVMVELTGDIDKLTPQHPVERHTGVLGLVLAF
ncbi:MAG: hypothetical protein COV67_13410 [Nitrospinae bacterium CG11_big_fil_rev_8_21_14_0_20_56_8]|nr:MAG: hypothetical protein COV67_13410 [Nitrospinae bacterium CG11_big_fil_rev_8_21_14_0_20_56_8]